MYSSIKPGVPFIVHRDSKLVAAESGQEELECLLILVSGEGTVKLLNFPKL